MYSLTKACELDTRGCREDSADRGSYFCEKERVRSNSDRVRIRRTSAVFDAPSRAPMIAQLHKPVTRGTVTRVGDSNRNDMLNSNG